jgi:Mg-chelatase subunit ChlD
VAVDATLRAAILRQTQDGQKKSNEFSVMPTDLHKKVRKRLRKTLIILVVDASDSMGTGTMVRMAAAKGAALALLTGAYQRRNRVGLVAFGGERAEVLLQPTAGITLAQDRLRRLPTGGATPFADGLWKAWQLVKKERAKDPQIKPILVVISDGEANVPLVSGQPVMEELTALAQGIRKNRIHSVAIDTKTGPEKSDEMLLLAKSLGATYHHINHLRASNVVEAVRAAES